MQKYNNLCDTQRNIYFLTRESLKEILWMKFAHWKILANAITQNFIFRFVAEPYIERDL